MPIIEVKNIPPFSLAFMTNDLENLQNELKTSVAGIEALELTPNQITCIFSGNRLTPKGQLEIIIEVNGLFFKHKRTYAVRNQLAETIGLIAQKYFDQALIEVFINNFNPDSGFWSAEK